VYKRQGLESAFGVLNTLLGFEDTVEILTRGRDRYGIPQPRLQEGHLANLTLFNPASSYVFEKEHLSSTSKNSMYLGTSLQGVVYGCIANNQMIS